MASEADPLVSVIVVSHNAGEYLGRCLRSLSGQDYGALEVIVVDNGSTEDLSGIIAAELSRAKYKRLDSNTGFARGNNEGMALASGQYLALINNDAVADRSWVRWMVKACADDAKCGAVASLVIDGNDPRVLDSFGVGVALDGMSHQLMSGAAVESAPQGRREVMAFSGCGCMVRRSALDGTALFDESFFAYCEDTDLSLRLLRKGWKIVAEPRAVITHYYSRTGGAFSTRKVLWIERNHFWVALRNFPLELLLCLPIATAWRLALQVAGIVTGRGKIRRFVSAGGIFQTVSALLRAHMAIVAGLGRVLAARRRIIADSVLSERAFSVMLRKNRMRLSDIILGRSRA